MTDKKQRLDCNLTTISKRIVPIEKLRYSHTGIMMVYLSSVSLLHITEGIESIKYTCTNHRISAQNIIL